VPSSSRFEGRTALVTGAASGVGVCDRDRQGATSVADAIGGGGRVSTHEVDQADERSVAELFELAARSASSLDVVCVNAGVHLPFKPLVDTPTAEWDAVHAVNLRGAFFVAREAARLMIKQGSGVIVFTSSTAALRAHPGAAPYAASKSGLLGLARSLAVELAPAAVRVNVVCPGGVESPMLESVFGDEVEEVRRAAHEATPLGRLAAPDDIAAAVAYLASADAAHVTGVELVVDGGSAAR
jgi:NAD(P)-dependent dehydrogenase (short-subunit alcohol dehydrogenase family)